MHCADHKMDINNPPPPPQKETKTINITLECFTQAISGTSTSCMYHAIDVDIVFIKHMDIIITIKI